MRGWCGVRAEARGEDYFSCLDPEVAHRDLGWPEQMCRNPRDVQIKLMPTTKASSSHGRGGEAREELRSRAALEQAGADTQGEGMKM